MPSQDRSSDKGTSVSRGSSRRKRSSPPPAPVLSTVSTEEGAEEYVQLEDGEHMLMAIVHAKALEANGEAGRPILNDPYAEQLLERCDINFRELETTGDPRWSRYICGRARRLDEWCQDFLTAHADEPVMVLDLGCGLDMRYWRVTKQPWCDSSSDSGGSCYNDGGARAAAAESTVRWMDVDRPIVVNLRQRLIDPPAGDYSLRTLNVGAPGWMNDIPADRRTLILAEGLFSYFTAEQAAVTIRELVDNFPSGELVFDVQGSFLARFSSYARPFRGTNVSLKWGVDDVRQLTSLHPKLVFKDKAMASEWLGNESFGKKQPPWFGPIATALASLSSSYRNNGQMARFEF